MTVSSAHCGAAQRQTSRRSGAGTTQVRRRSDGKIVERCRPQEVGDKVKATYNNNVIVRVKPAGEAAVDTLTRPRQGAEERHGGDGAEDDGERRRHRQERVCSRADGCSCCLRSGLKSGTRRLKSYRFTVLAGAFAVGQVSGAAFNPAVAVGATIRGLLTWSNCGSTSLRNCWRRSSSKRNPNPGRDRIVTGSSPASPGAALLRRGAPKRPDGSLGAEAACAVRGDHGARRHVAVAVTLLCLRLQRGASVR